ncbi:MAG: hypothetical protein SVX43_14710, partial [Cyanobacteriota bacterium]|nr:hypothetical protein [Cyanobacteriota bacterium]
MSESIVSQERRTQALVGESNPIKPWSVEQDADALMDDLFADFDRLLEGETQLPGETVRPEPSAMPAIAMPAIAPLAPLTVPPSTESGETLSVPQPESEISLPQTAPPTAAPQKPRSSTQHWDKLLLAFAIAALLGALAWLALQEKLKIQQWVEQWAVKVRGEPTASTEVASLSESDAQFANYMLRSLDLIERKESRAPRTASSSGQSALPPAPGTSSVGGTIPQVVNNYNIYQSAPGLANGLLPAPSPAAPAGNAQPSTNKAPVPPSQTEARSTAPATPPTSSQAAAPPA